MKHLWQPAKQGGGASSPPLLSPGWPTMWPRGRGRCQAGHCDRDFGPTENGAAVLGPLLPLASSSKRDPPRVLRHTQKVRPRAVARESVHFESHANPHRFVAAPRPRVSCTARPRRRAAPAVATSARAAPWSSSLWPPPPCRWWQCAPAVATSVTASHWQQQEPF